MVTAFLNFMFKTGFLFCISPKSTKKFNSTFFNKIYCIILILILISESFNALKYNDFYRKEIHIKRVVCLLSDGFLFVITSSNISGPLFWKHKQWQLLLKNLNKFHTSHSQYKLKKLPSLGFVLGIGFLVGIKLYSFSALVTKTEILHYFRICMPDFELFVKFIHSVMIWEILNIIFAEYKYIRLWFIEEIKTVNSLPHFAEVTAYVTKNIYRLKKTVENFNNIFGWSLTLNITYTTLQTLKNLDEIYVLCTDFSNAPPLKESLVQISVSITIFVITCFDVLYCDWIVNELESLLQIILRAKCLKLHTEHELLYTDLYHTLKKNCPMFWAGGFFVVDKSTILLICGNIINFLIIMIQFRNSN